MEMEWFCKAEEPATNFALLGLPIRFAVLSRTLGLNTEKDCGLRIMKKMSFPTILRRHM